MRVAAVQFKSRKGHKAAALAALRGLVLEAADGSDLVVLPEMAATGYLFRTPAAAREIAESPAGGPMFSTLASIARDRAAWIVAGFVEDAGRVLHNSAMVIDDHGNLAGVYRKTLLFPADELWAAPGDTGYLAFATVAGRFGVGICMDLNDDRFISWCGGSELDAIAFPTNWLDEGEDVHAYWRERLTPVDAALVAANTYGDEEPIRFSGRSAVMHRGRVLATAAETGDAIVRATIG